MSKVKDSARQMRSSIKRKAKSGDAILELYLRDIEKTIAHIRAEVKGNETEFIAGMAKRSRKRKGGLL